MPHTTNRCERGGAEFHATASLESGHEGIMAKAPGSVYATGARGQSWLKIKQVRTLDLVIRRRNGARTAQGVAEQSAPGRARYGKRRVRDAGQNFQGMTDQMLAWQTEELLKHGDRARQHTVYVEPKMVVEIAFNDIQVSPRYVSGFALRFARVKRYRTDKTAAEADTLEMVRSLAGDLGIS